MVLSGPRVDGLQRGNLGHSRPADSRPHDRLDPQPKADDHMKLDLLDMLKGTPTSGASRNVVARD